MPTNKKTQNSSVKVKSLMSTGLKFNRAKLLIFALLFAAVGGFIVYRSFAATSGRVSVNEPVVGIALASGNDGYILAGTDGGVFAEGSAKYEGSLPADGTNVNNIVGISETLTSGGSPTNGGYYLVGSDGGVFAFGNAHNENTTVNGKTSSSLPGLGIHVNNIVGIQATPGGGGYWLVGSDGGVYAFGNAGYYGSAAGKSSSPIVGMSTTYNGQGYTLVAADGGVFAFGDAGFHGSLPGIGKNVNNVVGVATDNNSGGYWMAGSDGGVYALPSGAGGTALNNSASSGAGGTAFYGSASKTSLYAPVVGIAETAGSNGYWLVAADGGVFAFGDAQFEGAVSYTYPPPSISSVSPNSGPTSGGTVITITGTHFNGVNSVTVGGVPTTFSSTSDGAITATTPPGAAGAQPVIVGSKYGTGTSSFIYVAPPPPPSTSGGGGTGTGTGTGGGGSTPASASAPFVNSVSPKSGPAGTVVTIAGKGFTGATKVTFEIAEGGIYGSATAQFTVKSDSTITATAPSGIANGNARIIITTPVGSSGGGSYSAFKYEASNVTQPLSNGTLQTTELQPSSNGTIE